MQSQSSSTFSTLNLTKKSKDGNTDPLKTLLTLGTQWTLSRGPPVMKAAIRRMAFLFSHMESSSQCRNVLRLCCKLWPLAPVAQVCKDQRMTLDEGKENRSSNNRAFLGSFGKPLHTLTLQPSVPRQTPPASLKGAPKLKPLGETWAFCIVRNGGAVWKKGWGRRRLTSELSLLTCSNSILLKLFIVAQCSVAKCFPSEPEGFKWIVLHCHPFLTETAFGISNIRQKIRAY